MFDEDFENLINSMPDYPESQEEYDQRSEHQFAQYNDIVCTCSECIMHDFLDWDEEDEQ